MNLLALDHIFKGRRIPPWLRYFDAKPEEAMRDLLLGGADLEHLNPADPERVLLDWIESFGPQSRLLPAIDCALVTWIKNNWSNPDPKGLGSAVAAVAWCRAADLISGCPGEEGLSNAAEVLRERFFGEPAFLRSIAEGRARDPEARAWLALAEHQSDRQLLPRWWLLCSLPPDVPWYHGELGIHGLRRLPPESSSTAGEFPKEVPEGLARLAKALGRRVRDGWLEAEKVRAEFMATARLTMAAYPFPHEEWLPYWRRVLQNNNLSETLAEHWVRDLSPELDQVSTKNPFAQRKWSEWNPEWKRREKEIAVKLQRGDHTAYDLAKSLLEEEKIYAQTNGDASHVTVSACTFASKIRKVDPRQALEWAHLALESDPWNAFAWTTMAAINLTLGNLSKAAEAAHEAVRRFPNDHVAYNTLAEVLKKQRGLSVAEDVYREAIRRFDQPDSHNGLAEVLRDQGRLREAEDVYRKVVRRFGSRRKDSLNGFAEILKVQGKFTEAEDVYREAIQRFDRPDSHNGLAEVFRAQGKFGEAEELYLKTIRRFNQPASLNGLAGVFKDQGRLSEAEALYRRVLKQSRAHLDAVYALRALVGLMKSRGELDEANRLFSELAQRTRGTNIPQDALESWYTKSDETAGSSEFYEESTRHARVTSPASEKVEHLSRDDLAILLTDTLFLRRWSRWLDRDRDKRAEEIRERAHTALESLLFLESRSSLAAGEAGLLTLAEGDLEEGLTLLREAARRFPGSARVRYALAYAERSAASARTLDVRDPEAAVRPWRRLARLEPQLGAVALLGEARTWLIQTDGVVREAGARRSLGRLGFWIDSQLVRGRSQPRDQYTELNAWWARETRRMVFGDLTHRVEEDLYELSFYLDMVRSHASELDLHEEESVYRVTSA